MKKLLIIFSLLFAALVFVSCGSDDEPSLQFDKNTIVGTWEITEVQGAAQWWWIIKGTTLKFNSNGTCSTGFTMEDSYKIEGGQVKTYLKRALNPMWLMRCDCSHIARMYRTLTMYSALQTPIIQSPSM